MSYSQTFFYKLISHFYFHSYKLKFSHNVQINDDWCYQIQFKIFWNACEFVCRGSSLVFFFYFKINLLLLFNLNIRWQVEFLLKFNCMFDCCSSRCFNVKGWARLQNRSTRDDKVRMVICSNVFKALLETMKGRAATCSFSFSSECVIQDDFSIFGT